MWKYFIYFCVGMHILGIVLSFRIIVVVTRIFWEDMKKDKGWHIPICLLFLPYSLAGMLLLNYKMLWVLLKIYKML